MGVKEEGGRIELSGKHAVNRALIGVCMGCGMGVLGVERGLRIGN